MEDSEELWAVHSLHFTAAANQTPVGPSGRNGKQRASSCEFSRFTAASLQSQHELQREACIKEGQEHFNKENELWDGGTY